MHIEDNTEKRERLMNSYLNLKPWDGVKETLRIIKDRGVKLGFLSNLTSNMLETNISNSGLDGMFDVVLSTDEIRTYKPSSEAYQLGTDALNLQRNETGFVAFAGWDAAGAKTFGYRTFWNNRANAPMEELGSAPDEVSGDFEKLIEFIKN